MKTNQLTTIKYYPADAVLTCDKPEAVWIGFKIDTDTTRILDCKWMASAQESVLNELVLFSDQVIGNLLEPTLEKGKTLFF